MERIARLKARVLKGHSVVSGHCRGVVLVSAKPLSFLGGVDYNSGFIIEKGKT